MSEPLIIPGTITIPFSYAAGAAASRFLVELRDHRRIMGNRCPSCKKVLVPARSFCAACWQDTDEWTEVGPEGALVTSRKSILPRRARSSTAGAGPSTPGRRPGGPRS